MPQVVPCTHMQATLRYVAPLNQMSTMTASVKTVCAGGSVNVTVFLEELYSCHKRCLGSNEVVNMRGPSYCNELLTNIGCG